MINKMTKKTIKIISFCSVFMLTGCFGLWDSGSDTIVGNYIVLWIDVHTNQTISKKWHKNSASSTQIVPGYVFAVGHNDDFIIAKQHPTGENYEVDTKTTNYYVIDIQQKKENVFGPLDRHGFDSLRSVLNIQKIPFDQNYPDK